MLNVSIHYDEERKRERAREREKERVALSAVCCVLAWCFCSSFRFIIP